MLLLCGQHVGGEVGRGRDQWCLGFIGTPKALNVSPLHLSWNHMSCPMSDICPQLLVRWAATTHSCGGRGSAILQQEVLGRLLLSAGEQTRTLSRLQGSQVHPQRAEAHAHTWSASQISNAAGDDVVCHSTLSPANASTPSWWSLGTWQALPPSDKC